MIREKLQEFAMILTKEYHYNFPAEYFDDYCGNFNKEEFLKKEQLKERPRKGDKEISVDNNLQEQVVGNWVENQSTHQMGDGNCYVDGFHASDSLDRGLDSSYIQTTIHIGDEDWNGDHKAATEKPLDDIEAADGDHMAATEEPLDGIEDAAVPNSNANLVVQETDEVAMIEEEKELEEVKNVVVGNKTTAAVCFFNSKGQSKLLSTTLREELRADPKRRHIVAVDFEDADKRSNSDWEASASPWGRVYYILEVLICDLVSVAGILRTKKRKPRRRKREKKIEQKMKVGVG